MSTKVTRLSRREIAAYQKAVAAHTARMLRRSQPVVNAASRARLRYEASPKGQAARARYTSSPARLASKERYRSTPWGMFARQSWYIQDRCNSGAARIEAMHAANPWLAAFVADADL